MQTKLNIDVIGQLKKSDNIKASKLLDIELMNFNKKIVVLDDDPTGVQTVNGVFVYTHWDQQSLLDAFLEDNNMFYILTNTRGLIADDAKKVNKIIAERLLIASQTSGKDFIIISRSDSTLRGHYPLETETLKQTIEINSDIEFDGEIIIPFFMEGGRYTYNNIHYVREGNLLIPAGETEFARDKAFGYKNSHLGKWCEEKTEKQYKSDNIIYISIEELRSFQIDKIEKKLLSVTSFNKVIINAIDYSDVKVFSVALIRAINKGKNFIFRSAAALPKIIGNIKDQDLLTRDKLIDRNNNNGGIIIVGSYVNKTTRQLDYLEKSNLSIEFIQFNTSLALVEGGLEKEVDRIVEIAEKRLINGISITIFTSRKFIDIEGRKDEKLKLQIKISNSFTSIIEKLNTKPSFIVAKGGITSSDVATKALKVKRAIVLGQVKPGIPVWKCGNESKFPSIPFIIFPGNVGEDNTLTQIAKLLI